ncbi:alpha/beta fold hydrolase [Falsigemmobacter faecalis]|uniref:Alpha/beta fold hydrolase n=1 Tax=Falsigemmobacter faecalis TaxID=2488730 RepID=A0A3P3DHZ6_9RHOB|nr:alpha/beta fold hydrolase [Falsigemmobacter faecalis]RRH73879.1 alpha/beta fold hydrolase [Falsigemmobacter faecalis]
MLNFIRHGEGSGVPLLIVHGLFGSGRNWGAIAKRLSARGPVITVDQRNHGESPRAATQSYEDMAADLAGVIEAHGGQADVLGHSMGGKAAMHLALTRPQMLRRLIVADIAPVTYNHSQSANIEAMRSLDLSGLNGSRLEADRRLQARLQDPALRAFFLQSLDLKSEPPRWRLNLDVLEAEMDKITGWPGTEGIYEGPTLFLTGAQSHYVQPEHKPLITAQFPRARFVKLSGAGHWLHAEKPREFEASILAWMEATGG